MKAGDKSHPLRTRWTLPELCFLGQRDGKIPTRGIAEYPGTRSGFDPKMPGCRKIEAMLPWSEEEVAILRTHYAVGESARSVSQLLPGRNLSSIQAHAAKPGIQSGAHLARLWNEEELAALRKSYPRHFQHLDSQPAVR
ncbi:TPA: hypothetical protein ACHTCC_004888 [Citrobacter freundii]